MTTFPTLIDYQNAADSISHFLSEKLPADLSPISMYQFGYIGTPGLSDLDLLIIVDDSFKNGLELIEYVSDPINNTVFTDKIFAHKPFVFPKSLAEKIGVFTFNKVIDFRLEWGQDIVFDQTRPLEQLLFQQIEFLTERFIDLIYLSQNAEATIHTIQLYGHSLIHSVELATEMGFEFDFKFIQDIENARERFRCEHKLRLDMDNNTLANGLINDCLTLLKYFSSIFENRLDLAFLQKDYQVQHSNLVYLSNFGDSETRVNFSEGNVLRISGLPFAVGILHSFYYNLDKNYLHADPVFKKALKDRVSFFKSLFCFNFESFGSAYGRGILSPFARGEMLDLMARKLISY